MFMGILYVTCMYGTQGGQKMAPAPWNRSYTRLWDTTGVQESNLDPLQEQVMFITTEPSLHPILFYLNHVSLLGGGGTHL